MILDPRLELKEYGLPLEVRGLQGFSKVSLARSGTLRRIDIDFRPRERYGRLVG